MKNPPNSDTSHAFSMIAQSRLSDTDKISRLHAALDYRFKLQGISVGYDDDRKLELQYMTRPEWVIRTLNCFFCCCENSGSLAREATLGLRLCQEMDEVGLTGCAEVLRAIKPLLEQQENLDHIQKKENLTEDECDERYNALSEQISAIEAEGLTEGFEECCTALWNYALRHQTEILG